MKRTRTTVRIRKIAGTDIEIRKVSPEVISMKEIRSCATLHNAKGKDSAAKKVRSGDKVRSLDKANSYKCDKALIRRKRAERKEAYLLRKEQYLSNH